MRERLSFHCYKSCQFLGINFYTCFLGRFAGEEVRKEVWLGGLFGIEKRLDPPRGKRMKKFYIASCPIWEWGKQAGYKTYSVLSKEVLRSSLLSSMLNKYRFQLTGADHIYLLNSNLGELYLFLSCFLLAMMKRDNVQKPVFVTDRKYHFALFRLLIPQAKTIKIDKVISEVVDKHFVFEGIPCTILYTSSFFIDSWKKLLKGQGNFFDSLSQEVGLAPSELELNPVRFSETLRRKVHQVIGDLHLNLERLIFLAPEANSCRSLHKKEVFELVKNLKEKGWSIFLNTAKSDMQDIVPGMISSPLSVDEAIYLASLSKHIIAVRSGLLDALVHLPVTIHVINTPMKGLHAYIPSDLVAKGWDLNTVAFKKAHIFPYIYTQDIISQILSHID